MEIVLRTFSTNCDYNADCDCGVIEVTPQLLDVVRRRVAIAQQALSQDKELWGLYFWDGGPDFYDSDFLDACDEADAGGDDADDDDSDSPAWTDRFAADGYLPLPAGVLIVLPTNRSAWKCRR